MIVENKNSYITNWLLVLISLVCLIIFIGGLTRLTDSGLSITRWDLFMGIFPPLSPEKWEYTFSLYKEIPEYKLINVGMTLSEFKTIYWWEYIHRFLGRLIGITYLLPLIFFNFKKIIPKNDLIHFYLIFLLICFQGLVGWYMVKSGLTERTDVSHFRLSLHLTIAFLILIFLILKYFKFNYLNNLPRNYRVPFKLPLVFLILVLLQISLGALVSGLDAGQIYQTWPLMNQDYFPDDSTLSALFSYQVFEIPSMVQFMHRNFAYLIIILFLILTIIIFKNHKFSHLKKSISLLFFFLFFQILLGILTILSGAHILYASLHQVGSILLTIASLNLFVKDSRIN